VNESQWDYKVQLGYGFGDAGVVLASSKGSLVRNVSIETPSNGVLARWSDETVVENVSVRGARPWWEGFMGVMVMDSRVVVQDSRFNAGRDGVYTHRSHALVVRNNTMRSMRFGVHEMYTSNALIANNTVRNASTGLIVMTRPRGNILARNDVRRSDSGIVVAGSASYVVDNTLRKNGIGLDVSAMRSLYAGNRVTNNDVGVRGSTLIPTNRVVDNSVVDNERTAIAVLGPLRVWPGNYWSNAPGIDRDDDGTLDRSFHPTGPVDGRISTAPSATTLSYSPAVRAYRQLQSAVPGLRGTGVVDPRPRVGPANSVLDTPLQNESVVP
jgi:nitrous oxidase accessory protein NosD